MSDFKWRHFQGDVILWAVRWYCRYGVSYRDLGQMMGKSGVIVDHSTIIARSRNTRQRLKSGCVGTGDGHSQQAGGSMRPM